MTQIRTTSKLSLKLSCLNACGMDVKRAEELYQYIASGIESLPDFDAVPVSTLQQVKQGADEVLSWFGQHREELAKGLDLIRGLRGRMTGQGGGVPESVANIPPIPEL